MAVYKDPKPTKNGRAWYFKFSYKDAFGATKQYRFKRYLTKKETSYAERMFSVTSTDIVEDNNMTFKDLYDEFKKFISYEEDLRWKCVFEILYYCGLRKRELKGLTWKDIYFDKKNIVC